MNKKDFEDETKFKKYIKEIYNNDTWLIHKKQLDFFQNTDIATDDEIEVGQLYLMKDRTNMYFYYYLSASMIEIGRNVGFLIYLPTEEFKKEYPSLTPYSVYYEKPTTKYLKLSKHLKPLYGMFLNWINENPFEVKS